jgi:hypothetical protein
VTHGSSRTNARTTNWQLKPLGRFDLVPPAGFEPATHGLGTDTAA